MRSLAVHTYLGAMALGVEHVGEVLASVETWKVGIRARRLANVGCKSCGMDDFPRDGVDLVFANPPCSRYSSSAVGAYSGDDRSDVGNFDDLREVMQVTEQTGARAMWWETGPLLWTMGRGMVEQQHRWAEKLWGRATTLVIRIDPRWLGVPQARPRCHVISAEGDTFPAEFTPNEWPRFLMGGNNVGSWLDEQMRDRWKWDGIHTPVEPDFAWEFDSPKIAARCIRESTLFIQNAPAFVRRDDPFYPAVLSGRCSVWEDEDRWTSIEEFAALMSYPPEAARRVALERSPREALMMLSKGVSSDVSRYVAETAAAPMLEGNRERVGENLIMWGDGLFEIDLKTGGTKRRSKQ